MHELANQIQMDPVQKAPQFYLHHPLLMERVYEEKVVKEEKSKKASRQYPSRTQLKESEVVLTKSYLQEKFAKRMEQMTPEGRRQFITNTLKPFMAIHHGITSKELMSPSTDSSVSSKAKDGSHEINILCYMTSIFCRSMNMQSEDELLQTLVMQTNQSFLNEQSKGLENLGKSISSGHNSKGSKKFWITVGVVAGVCIALIVVGLIVGGGLALTGGILTAGAGAITSGVGAGVGAAAGIVGGILSTLGTVAVVIPLLITVVAAIGTYCGFKYGGTDDDLPHGKSPDQAQLTQVSTKTQAEQLVCGTLNNNIQQSTKRVDDDSTQVSQEGNYVQQAIQDLGSVMKMGN